MLNVTIFRAKNKPCILSFIMLNVIMLCVNMLNIIMLSVIMLNVIMLSVIMLNVIMLSVVMLRVVAPLNLLSCTAIVSKGVEHMPNHHEAEGSRPEGK
jgi:hypothetical protein